MKVGIDVPAFFNSVRLKAPIFLCLIKKQLTSVNAFTKIVLVSVTGKAGMMVC